MSAVKICPTCNSEYPVSERFCPRDGSALRGQNTEGDLVGTVIADRYHVMKKLGEGGMGTVYLAEHVKMGRKSALKVMNPGMSHDADAIARFNREASNASRLNHPNICAIYDFGETPEGLIYLAMEFIEGESLTSIIEGQGALAPARAGSILHQAADGLQVAHDSGIVHRDLKPDNIMIAKGRDGADLVKVVDFGIAKAHTSDAQKVTKTGLVVGTPEYMSPEQLAGDKLDGRSDIYSLALVGFNMLTGTLPFPSTSAQESMIMRLTDNPRPLSEMKPDTAWPAALQTVMDKALARDAKDRYEKASDFGRDYAMAIERMPSKAMTEARTQVVGSMRATPNAPTQQIPQTRLAAASPEAAPPTVEPARTPVAKKGMGMMIGAGGFMVVAIVAAIYVIGQQRGTQPNDSATQPDGATKTDFSKADSGNKLPLGNSGAASGGGQGTQRGRESGGGGSTPPVTPPSGGDPRGAGGGNSAALPVTRADLDALKAMADSVEVKTPNAALVARVIDVANGLIARAQGDELAEALLQRGSMRVTIKDKGSGCADLRRARLLVTKASLKSKIEFWFDDNLIEDPCSPQ